MTVNLSSHDFSPILDATDAPVPQIKSRGRKMHPNTTNKKMSQWRFVLEMNWVEQSDVLTSSSIC